MYKSFSWKFKKRYMVLDNTLGGEVTLQNPGSEQQLFGKA
jgi:hypothetical protein